MKSLQKFPIIALLLISLVSCGNLINDMDNQTTEFLGTTVITESEITSGSKSDPEPVPPIPLTLEETAIVLEDFLNLQFNDDEEALEISFPIKVGDPDVVIQSLNPCVSITGDTAVDYRMGDTSWDADLQITLSDCASAEGQTTGMNTTFDLHLHGPFGSVTSYNLKGILTAEGAVGGTVSFDISYSVKDCIFKWDCWSGEANGFPFDELKPMLSI